MSIVLQIVTHIGVTYIGPPQIIGTTSREVPMTQLDAKMKVGLRIKELRNALGYSQEALAFSIEMSRTYFAEVETGKRNISIENIERIARGLGVSLREFFDSDLFTGWLGDGLLEKYLWMRGAASFYAIRISRDLLTSISAENRRCRIRLHYVSPEANGATRRAEFESAGRCLHLKRKTPAPACSTRVRVRS